MHVDYYNLLRRIANHDIADILSLDARSTEIFGYLERMGYVVVPMHGYNNYHITDIGLHVLSDEEDRIALRREEHSYRRRKDRAEAIRYAITTAIALAALIKSFWPDIIAAAERLSRILAHR